MSVQTSDFVPVSELSKLTGRSLKTLQNDHSAGRGPLSKILTKFGGRLGCWRADYDAWIRSQRKLSDAA
jgi:hypothetical protein